MLRSLGSLQREQPRDPWILENRIKFLGLGLTCGGNLLWQPQDSITHGKDRKDGTDAAGTSPASSHVPRPRTPRADPSLTLAPRRTMEARASLPRDPAAHKSCLWARERMLTLRFPSRFPND